MCFKSPKCDGIPLRRCDGSFEDGDEVLPDVNDVNVNDINDWCNLFAAAPGVVPSWSKFATRRLGWARRNGGASFEHNLEFMNHRKFTMYIYIQVVGHFTVHGLSVSVSVNTGGGGIQANINNNNNVGSIFILIALHPLVWRGMK